MLREKFSKRVLLLVFLSFGCLIAGIYIYRKKNQHQPVPSLSAETSTNVQTSNNNFFFDLETTHGLSGVENIKQSDIAHSGKMVCDLSGGKEFGFSVIKKMADAGPFPLKRAGASVWIYPLSEKPNVVVTGSIVNSKNETIFWDGKSTEKIELPANKWTKVNALYNFPVEKLNADDVIQINIWNRGKTDVLVDDLEVVYGESNERRGTYSGIDANLFYEKQFVSQRNKPPFPTILFKKLEINNNDSTQLIKGNNNLDLSPNEEYLVGDFIEDKNNLDELLHIKGNKTMYFLRFNPEKQKFEACYETNLENYPRLRGVSSLKYAGDFNADGKTDILIAERDSWFIFEFNNERWILVSEGKTNELKTDWFGSNNHPFVSDLFSENKKDAFVLVDSNSCYLLQLNTVSKKLEEKQTTNTMYAGSINLNSHFYQGDFTGHNKAELLKYTTEWRFDLKLIEKDEAGFKIIGNIDFTGFKNDYNPKYYEFIKIIPGNFTSSKKTSILTITRNCGDPDFNGVNCKTFENLNYLPNSIQLYTISDNTSGK